jgi:hypothetical protein
MHSLYALITVLVLWLTIDLIFSILFKKIDKTIAKYRMYEPSVMCPKCVTATQLSAAIKAPFMIFYRRKYGFSEITCGTCGNEMRVHIRYKQR